jgi:hypothetical protein
VGNVSSLETTGLAFKERTVAELVQIAQAGGSLEVDAARYALEDLHVLARALPRLCVLKIRSAEGISTDELESIMACAPGRVRIA